MVGTSDIIKRLSEMKGTVHVFRLDDKCREKILEIEKDIKAAMLIPCINAGVEECLKRQHVFAVIKNRAFRPPPEATVVLYSDDGTILGEEILPYKKKQFLEENKEDIVWLSEEFVMYPERKGRAMEFFVMPPVSFPEMDEMGMKNVVSCSPSAPSDMMLREKHGFVDDPKLASILIGFDSEQDLGP
jgi:hypothetical protein